MQPGQRTRTITIATTLTDDESYSTCLVIGLHCPGKRTVDVVAASVLLLTLLPVMVVIAVSVKLTSRGPVIFRQVRVGKDVVELLPVGVAHEISRLCLLVIRPSAL